MAVRINIHRIQHINTYGFVNRIHTTLSTVKAMVMTQKVTRDLDRDMMENTHQMSISIMLSFLCESGMVRASADNLCAVRQRILSRSRHEKVSNKLGSVLSIVGVLRHITCMAICGDMYTEEQMSSNNMCSAAMHHGPSSDLQSVNWRSWSSLEQSMRLGEVLRLSFVLEENFKKNGLVPDDCISVIIREVVERVQTVVGNMVCVDTATTPKAMCPKSKHKASAEGQTSFSKMASQMMVEIVIAGILAMETPSKTHHAYSVLCVNMLELYGQQYMHWNHAHKPADNFWTSQHKNKKHPAGNARDIIQSQQRQELCILEKQRLMARTIRVHGRQMVYEQLKHMVTNVSGLSCILTENILYTEEKQVKMQKTTSLLCPEMKLKTLSATVLHFERTNIGIHLLRPVSSCPYDVDESNSFLQRMTMTTNLTQPQIFADAYSHQDDIMREMPLISPMHKIPCNLYYVLKHAHYALSSDISADDPRHKLITAFRQEILLAYLDIIYSVWAAV